MNNRATGVLVVHSAPRALSSHVEWAVNAIVGVPLRYRWKQSPLVEDAVRVDVYWDAPIGSAATIASTLRGWKELRFEITEDAGPGALGVRIAHTPALGLSSVSIDAGGNIVVTEHQIESILQSAGGDLTTVRDGFDRALSGAWERDLEPFRAARYDSSVRLLRGVS